MGSLSSNSREPFLQLSLGGIKRVSTTLSSCLLLYILAICVYRLFFHPFSKYPGPLLAKLTDAYGGYHAWKQDTHLEVFRLHETYGDFIRYGPNRLIINRHDALKDIYSQGSNFYKGRAYEVMRINPVHSVFFVQDKNIHRRKRKVISQGFSDSAIRASEEHQILPQVERFCTRLLEKHETFEAKVHALSEGKAEPEWTCPKNLSTWSEYLAMDIISNVTFNRSYSMLHKADLRFITEAHRSYGRRMAIAFEFPSAFRPGRSGQWLDLGTWLLPSMDKLRQNWVSIGRQWALDRIDAGGNKVGKQGGKDIMSTIISAIDPDTSQPLSTAEIAAEAITLVTAGGDTSAAVISSTFFYLSRNASAYSKCAEEIRTKFSSVEEIHNGSKLNSCVYLRACLDEAMRMNPPLIAPPYREAGAGGASVAGHFIPQGMEVATQHYSIHHKDSYFPQPFDYCPERWIIEAHPLHVSPDAKVAFSPFSVGPRNCAGMNLANLEMMLVVARVLFLADFKTTEDEELRKVGEGGAGLGRGRERKKEFQVWDVWASARDGPWLEFRRRKAA